MTDAVLISIITGIVSTIQLLISISIKKKQVIIHKQIDGMKDELVAATAKASTLEGNKEGRQELKQEIKEDKLNT